MGNDDHWADAQRVESWAGEVRVNLIRLAAVLIFYGHHLVNVYLFRDDPAITDAYHAWVTTLVVAWVAGVLGIHLCLVRRWMPPALKYAATAWDTILVTALLVLGGDPRSMLAVLYFPVIGAAGLRLSLPLVYAATFGTMAGFVFFQGYFRLWLQLSDEQLPGRPQQVVFLLALGATGVLVGQAVRQTRHLVEGHAITVDEPQE